MYDSNETISIKVTKTGIIYCSDIERFSTYDFNKKNTIIVLQYEQNGEHKILKRIYEINYNKKCHDLLFGNLPLETITNYVKSVKKIPIKTKGHDATKIFDYIAEKHIMNSQYTFNIQINPKVDSSQSRVQCSIPHFEELLEDFITYKSEIDNPNVIRGIQIDKSIHSPPRQRGGINIHQLKQICRDNNIKRYSTLRKNELIELLKNKGITLAKSH